MAYILLKTAGNEHVPTDHVLKTHNIGQRNFLDNSLQFAANFLSYNIEIIQQKTF